MSGPVFISADAYRSRLAEQYAQLRDAAIDAVNRLIKDSKEQPIILPADVLTSIDCVRGELIRQLKERGWDVASVVEEGGEIGSYKLTVRGNR